MAFSLASALTDPPFAQWRNSGPPAESTPCPGEDLVLKFIFPSSNGLPLPLPPPPAPALRGGGSYASAFASYVTAIKYVL